MFTITFAVTRSRTLLIIADGQEGSVLRCAATSAVMVATRLLILIRFLMVCSLAVVAVSASSIHASLRVFRMNMRLGMVSVSHHSVSVATACASHCACL